MENNDQDKAQVKFTYSGGARVPMNVSPLDIRKHQFKRAFTGFDRDEVVTFLELAASDMEKLLRENAVLNERINSLEEKNRDFQAMQDTLQGAMLTAEKNAGEKIQAANREADLIVREAELKGREIVDRCQKHAALILRQISDLKGHRESNLNKYRSFLESALRQLNEINFEEEERALNGLQIARQASVVFDDEYPAEEKVEKPEVPDTGEAGSEEE